MRRRAKRQMAFAAEQAGGRVQADPARAGQIDFGPGVQVGEIVVCVPFGPSSGSTSALKLDQIAGDEARGEAEMAQDLHQQPGGIAARARRQRQRLSGAWTPGSMRIT